MTRWFARTDLSAASKAQQRVFEQVLTLLDQLQPVRLDPAQQSVEPERGETWVRLRHDAEPWMRIELAMSDGWVNFYGVMGHDEAYSMHTEPKGDWESDTIDILADLLRADYSLDRYTLGGKLWREVINIGEPYDQISTGPNLAAALPLKRWAKHTESRHATFGCRGARPIST